MDREKLIEAIEAADRVIRAEAESVLALASRLGRGFQDALGIITSTGGRVIVCGMGKSGIIGKKIAATMASTGTPAFYMHPAEASHGDLGMVTNADVVLAISNSGETDELLALLPFMKRFGVRIVAMTGAPESTLARAADAVLDVSVTEEACPMGVVPTSSTTATLAMGDALAVALLVLKGFGEEDFATFHPRGALGKKLLTRVSDLMHAGSAMPTVRMAAPMSETLLEISSGRLGLTLVLADDRTLAGIITDGDLRRGIASRGRDFFDLTAGEAMTRGPRTIAPGELAASALAVMQERSITSLVVASPDSPKVPLGVIHIHDILREGIA